MHFSGVTFADCGLEIRLNANMWVQLEVFWEQKGATLPRTKIAVCVFDRCGEYDIIVGSVALSLERSHTSV